MGFAVVHRKCVFICLQWVLCCSVAVCCVVWCPSGRSDAVFWIWMHSSIWILIICTSHMHAYIWYVCPLSRRFCVCDFLNIGSMRFTTLAMYVHHPFPFASICMRLNTIGQRICWPCNPIVFYAIEQSALRVGCLTNVCIHTYISKLYIYKLLYNLKFSIIMQSWRFAFGHYNRTKNYILLEQIDFQDKVSSKVTIFIHKVVWFKCNVNLKINN